MIGDIKFKFGRKKGAEPISIKLSPITIFIGPNNSGKSLALREIEKYIQNGKAANYLIIEEILPRNFSEIELGQALEKNKISPNQDEHIPNEHIKFGKFNISKGNVERIINPKNILKNNQSSINPQFILNQFVNYYTARLGGQERLQLISNQSFSDLKSKPNSALMALFQNNTLRKKVREIIHEAFKKYFVIDPTNMSQLQIRISDEEPINSTEKGWDEDSVKFHSNAKPISDFSDGVKAFVGLVIAAMAGDDRVLLLDEPEAFLHPSLSNLLGKRLSTIMDERGGNLIVSTHSPHFLMGCLQSGKQLSIVRLTYSDQIPTIRCLEAQSIHTLFRNPLLRSSGVLQSLFHNSVIVTEGNPDRAFYNEINERLLHCCPEKGIEGTIFLNAENHQTIWSIIKPLREMGIPSAAIVDIDVIQNGGEEFNKLIKAAFVPEAVHQSFQSMRKNAHDVLMKHDVDFKKNGLLKLEKTDRESVLLFANNLADYGVFFVPNGALESWLPNLKATDHGSRWLVSIFEKMGHDPESEAYLQPANGDVWEFLYTIKKWVSNPDRKGLPD